MAGAEARDNFQWIWFLWWGKKAWLDLGTSVTNLKTLYYPTGAYHPLLAAEPYVQLLALPLVSLFGPKVLDALGVLKAEMAKTRAGGKSELMDLLIAYKWHEMFGGFDRDPATIEWKRA